ncbi:MAG: right-handed parallel beta-helix repeat-containing protein [Rhodocyclaceae bacterium]|nr:right-handed parallel beta-helix repeat-containing protein [Rhodocyclaceae bacterium]
MSKVGIFAGVVAVAVAAATGYTIAKQQSSFSGSSVGAGNTPSAEATLSGMNAKATGNTGAALLAAASSAGKVIMVKPGSLIQDAVNQAKAGDTIQVLPGTYSETVYIDKDNISLIGVIKEGVWPVLDGLGKLNDAVLYSGNGIRIENLKIVKYKGNAIMGQAGNNFVIRHNWIVDTGVYGIFPQLGQNGLIEYNVLSGIEDAAIYVGMSDNVHVAHNEVFASVAGIEIENSRHAIVENNMVYDNAGGILTFITPGLPIKSTFDVIIRNNFIVGNNHKNFGAVGSIVSGVPSGTGVLVMAADDVVIENNIIRDNKNAGIIVTDHKNASNISPDPESDPNPDRVSILRNNFSNNGYEPIPEVKALMVASLTRQGPDVVAVGAGTGSCMLDRAAHATLGIGSWSNTCAKNTTADIATLLLDKPAPPRSTETADKGKVLYNGICAGCHAYNARMIGPPTQIIQAMYAGNAQGIAEYIAKPVKKRDDFPPMPTQAHLNPEMRRAVADYMLSVKK